MKGYVILEIGFEYDDSEYYTTEGGGGHAVNIFFDRESAIKRVRELEFNRHTQVDLDAYQICPNDYGLYEDFMDKMFQKYGLNPKAYNWDNVNKFRPSVHLNDEERETYLSFFSDTYFFSVEEAEIDKGDYRNFKIDNLIN